MEQVGHNPCVSFPRNSQDVAAWPFDQEFYLILNLAVGGNWGASTTLTRKSG